jgi:hypothetical protein
VPGCPSCISDPTAKVSLIKKGYPADEEFKTIFPTLLSKEMPYIELQTDE